MTKRDYELIARVLAIHRHVEANATIGSTVALITLDLSDALALDNPRFNKLTFWNAVEDARISAKIRREAA